MIIPNIELQKIFTITISKRQLSYANHSLREFNMKSLLHGLLLRACLCSQQTIVLLKECGLFLLGRFPFPWGRKAKVYQWLGGALGTKCFGA